MDQNAKTQAQELLKAANSVIILLPPQADTDSLTAGLSLHQSLKQAGKSSVIGTSTLPATLPDVQGVKEIQKSIGNQKLVVSFDYKEAAVENVSYDIDETSKRFNLIIQPKEGQTPLDPATVSYSFSGASADLVITFGINSLEELGRIYSDEKQFLDQAKIINISASTRQAGFAAANLSAAGKSSCELVGRLLFDLNYTPSPEAATNLYRQLLSSTSNFQSPQVDAETFELAAFLLRHDAKKPAAVGNPTFTPRPQASAPQIFHPQTTPSPKPFAAPPQSVPQDWQKPKIFKSSGALK